MRAFFGYHIPNFTFLGLPPEHLFDTVVKLARAAEAADFDMVTVMDHFYQIGAVGPETSPMLEAHTTLAALATQTKRVLLGTLVTGVTYRNPALLAKMVTTIDIISKGRAMLSIGAAWNKSEYIGYGFEFPPISQRTTASRRACDMQSDVQGGAGQLPGPVLSDRAGAEQPKSRPP
ncbi:MAG TPA: LLM class flavin-dependent oxidoreductase [Candidatus Acidoferrales bacterium]|nr:LLM class flavin-dependent oxidoreductase [Candidatus Acidoferrales bacterium]